MWKIIIILVCLFGGLGFIGILSVLRPAFITRFPITKGVDPRDQSNGFVNYYYDPLTRAVYWSSMGNWFELGFSKLEGADLKSFEVVSGQDMDGIAKDKNHIYLGDFAYDNSRLDVASFENVGIDSRGYHYMKDNRNVYTLDINKTDSLVVLHDADIKTFILENGIAKDKTHVYFGQVVYDKNRVDTSSLQNVGKDAIYIDYLKDAVHVYTFTNYKRPEGDPLAVLAGADPATFVIQENVAKDAGHVFWGYHSYDSSFLDVDSFVYLEMREGISFMKDKKHVYKTSSSEDDSKLQVVSGADPVTFKLPS